MTSSYSVSYKLNKSSKKLNHFVEKEDNSFCLLNDLDYLDHDDLVDAPFAGRGDGADVEGDLVVGGSLASESAKRRR